MALRPQHRLALLLAALLAASFHTSPAVAQQDPKARYRAGIGLLHRGMNDLAETELLAFLDASPDAPEAASARYALSVCLVNQGKHAEASTQLDRLADLREFEFAPDAALLRARCSLEAGKFDEAASLAGGIVRDHPRFTQLDQASLLRAEALHRAGHAKQAHDELLALVEARNDGPVLARAELLCASTEAALGLHRLATERLAALRASTAETSISAHATLLEAQCRQHLGETPEALDLFAQAARLEDPLLASPALLGLAQTARECGDAARASKALEDLIRRKPPAPLLTAAHLEQARLLLDNNEPRRAAALLDSIAAHTPDDFADDIAFWRAKTELRLDHPADAADRLAAAATAFPNSPLLPEILFDLAGSLSLTGKSQSAADVYADLARQFPNLPLAAEARIANASCLLRAGDHDGCAAVCQEYLSTNDGTHGATSARLLLAESRFMAGRFDEAEALYADFASRYPADPNLARAAVQRGICFARLGRADDARKSLSDAIDSHPQSDPSLLRAARLELGELSFSAGRWADAERCFSPLAKDLSNAPASPDILLRLGLSIQRQDRPADALAIYDRLIAAEPDSPRAAHARFERAQALLALGRADEARTGFESLAADESDAGAPFKALALRQLGSIALHQGRPDEAASLLAQAAKASGAQSLSADMAVDEGTALLDAGKFADAEQVLSQFTMDHAVDPRAPEAAARRAIAIARQGRAEEALRELNAALNPDTALPADLAASARCELASRLFALGRADEAESELRRLCSPPAPASIRAHAALEVARLLLDRAQYADADAILDQAAAAISAAHGAGAALADRECYFRALSAFKQERPDKAVALLDKFQTRFPQSPLQSDAAILQGESLLRSGRATDAIRTLQDLLESRASPTITRSALLRLADAHAQVRHWTAAEQAYAQFLQDFSDSDVWFQARFGQGWCRENQGRHEAAIEAYTNIVARHQGPTAARAQFQIGECLYAMKRHEDAVRELMKVDLLYTYPEWSAAALYEAGRCFLELKRPTDAGRQFDDVIARFDKTNWASLARQRLSEMKPDALPGLSRTAPTTPTGQERKSQ